MDDVQVALLARLRVVRIHQLEYFSFGDHIGRIRHNLHHALRMQASHHLKGAAVDKVPDQDARLIAEDFIRRRAAAALGGAVDHIRPGRRV